MSNFEDNPFGEPIIADPFAGKKIFVSFSCPSLTNHSYICHRSLNTASGSKYTSQPKFLRKLPTIWTNNNNNVKKWAGSYATEYSIDSVVIVGSQRSSRRYPNIHSRVTGKYHLHKNFTSSLWNVVINMLFKQKYRPICICSQINTKRQELRVSHCSFMGVLSFFLSFHFLVFNGTLILFLCVCVFVWWW